MIGPGKYDDVCTAARQAAKARGAILIVFEGEHGHGFSAQVPPEALANLPDVLRQVADEIARSGPLAV